MATQSQLPRVVRFGNFEIDVRAGELRRNGVKLKLQEQPFQILCMLVERPGEVVTREELCNKLWSADTFVDFDHSLNAAIKRLRDALGESADAPVFIETMARRGYRFIAPLATRPDSTKTKVSTDAEAQAIPQNEGTATHRGLRWKTMILAGVAVAAPAAVGYFYLASAPKLTDKDSIVLADFVNTTGESVFDDTLKQGLRVQLEQSPFLNILSDQKVDDQLKLMGSSAGERLTHDLARDLCQRAGSKAVLNGSISRLGKNYVIGLSALRCDTGDTLGSEQVEVDNQEHVLRALGESATKMRRRLGESLATIQKYDAPIEQATTSSLEALKAYSLGMKAVRATGTGVATVLPFFQRAVELDPKFAMSFARMGTTYCYLDDKPVLSEENLRKAYELRLKVSERERLYIDEVYYKCVTGELEKVAQLSEVWQQTYPQDAEPYHELAFLYARLFGKYEAALEEAREAVRLEPENEENYSNLCFAYRWLDRLDEAEAVLKQAEQRKLESTNLLEHRYELAFLKGDKREIERLMSDSTDNRAADYFRSLEAWAEIYHGRLTEGRKLLRPDTRDSCDVCARLSLIEAHFGVTRQARLDATKTLKANVVADSRIALALALVGDSTSARNLAEKLNESHPQKTLIQRYRLPTIRAAIALERKNPDQAVELLRVTSPYELGAEPTMAFEPIYLRGQAYLLQHNGNAAAVEFQKIIDHPGIVKTEEAVVGSLAGLGLARAYALESDSVKSRAAYQDFLRLWKDADPDIPILKQAKAEYAKLQ
jgi:DNA-binding winged helix-turn-helix (wHTH) protein/tetratricopeptide (TPR) repeat protein